MMNKLYTLNIILRSKITQEIRNFFNENQFLEIQTPVRIAFPALEDYIDAIPAPSSPNNLF
ncbi:MAG: amino acid--tRNA ligase-related protein, partial [Lentisphaeria bacterium]